MSCILYFLTHSTEAADEEVNLESKEIIEDQLVSIISKDYLDVFSKCWCGRLFNSREFQLLLIILLIFPAWLVSFFPNANCRTGFMFSILALACIVNRESDDSSRMEVTEEEEMKGNQWSM